MKLFILSVCVVLAAADVSHILEQDKQAQIIKQALNVEPDGPYQWNIETSNGIVASETGSLKNAGAEDPILVAQGEAAWTAPDGTPVQIQYIADENGYQPQGPLLPTPPPIPEAILRALEWIRAHPPPVEKN